MFDQAIIYRSEMDYISRCIQDHPDEETGGQLFGLWTNSGLPVIMYVVGPGPKANHQKAFFNQDIDYLTEVGTYLFKAYGLVHLGEWHSHHQLGLVHPSSHDCRTMKKGGLQTSNHNRFLLCIGNLWDEGTTLGAFGFSSDSEDYESLTWKVKETESPFRPIIDHVLAPVLCHPSAPTARYATVQQPFASPNILEVTYPAIPPFSTNTPDYDNSPATPARTSSARAARHSRRKRSLHRKKWAKAKAKNRRAH